MKKNIFSIAAIAAALILGACGNNDTPAESAASQKPTSSKTASSKPAAHTHTFDETRWETNEEGHWHPATCEHTSQKGSYAAHTLVDWDGDATHVPAAATCTTPGKAFKKCSTCGHIKEIAIPALGHDFDMVPESTVTEADKTEWYKVACSHGDAAGIGFSAVKYTAISGSNKDTSNATLKLNTNGNYVDYVINVPADVAMANCTIWMHGWVDYFKDGSTNNDQRGFFSGKADCPDGNFKFTVNSNVVTITNTKTYEEMGLKEGDGSNNNASTFGFVEVGASAIKEGENTIRYERVESYNMNIDAIYFIAPVAAHA
ncbi:MAG: hypothetical protein J6328_00775 [Bacilli bacterium]|nr:hypothetical protein [Bacilli bacterium]